MSRPTTQTARLLRYLEEHPGATSLDITINLRIVNVTGRVSDLRKEGHNIECRRERTVDRYYLVREGQTSMGLVA